MRQFSAVESARAAILAQLADRQTHYPQHCPAHPWVRLTQVTSYIFDLPAERLRQNPLPFDAGEVA